MNKHVMLALGALALAACGQQAQQAQTETDAMAPPEMTAQTPAMTDAQFVNAAVNASHYEIELSELAADRAARQEVKDLAATMASEHNAATTELAQTASALNLATPTPTLDAGQNDRLNNLRNNSGATFDDAFLDTQAEVAENTVELFENYLATAPEGEMRTFAENTLPTLRSHLERVQSLENAT